ncbi:MAG: glycosyltransferase family 2 protein [Desulfovibrionaceae bacterium]
MLAASPRVSVIMNCLNSATDLRAAMDSVMAQTFPDWEIIFWDNGSTDSSPDIAQSYGPKVRYFRAATTVPLGAARNLAIAKAQGAYIAFLDCDDLWLPTKLERQVALFDANPRLGLVCTDTEIFTGKRVRSRLFSKGVPPRGMVFAQLLQDQWISMSSAMIRRTALDSLTECFDESLNMCEEADLFYRIAHNWELDYVDGPPLTRWRVHAQNTTFRKFGKFADETIRILEKHRHLYPQYDVEYAPLVALLTRRAAFQRGISLWREGHNADARACVRPYAATSPKYRLFMWVSWLPGFCFDALARLYFSLPDWLRR